VHYWAGNVFRQTNPKRGLGRSFNGGLGGQSPPTAKPSKNGLNPYVGSRSRCIYCARFMCMLFPKLMHTHQYLYYILAGSMFNWGLVYRSRITDCSWKTRQPLVPKSTSKDKRDARRGMLLFHHHSSDDYQSFDSMSGCKWLMEFNPQSFTRLRQKKASPIPKPNASFVKTLLSISAIKERGSWRQAWC